ncbi:hypothetical protein F5Y04DRAFT_262207 [Hypomontagnella monticulosa]|nr:hypothetical protein F5Y04DRAFT_262207 [Hypomontagnella monticulosa]
MMASDISRPPSTENGGSRPPTSRFVEGSMNDRISAVPPAKFLGPGQLREFERQFYNDLPKPQREARAPRRDRPFSESSVPEQTNAQEHIITHRKSTGFFGRVREVLGWNSSSRSNGGAHKHDSARKHNSLQEPLQHQPHPPLPPRPDHLRAAKSYSEMHSMPQLPNFSNNGASRPSREDVMQSYNELMATGFFQSHAIQSTRHAGPASRGNDRLHAPPMPSIPGSAPCSPQPPPRTSSIDATSTPNSPLGLAGAEYPGRKIPRPMAEERSTHMLANREVRYPSLRGRKRNRTDTEEIANIETAGGTASTPSSFAQPLKRVAKKLRKMPSSTKETQVSDGVIRLPPSTSIGGTTYLKEKAVRLRSPSPAPPHVNAGSKRPNDDHDHDHRSPRRTFSNGSRGDGNKLRKRGKSDSLRSRSGSASGAAGFETWEMAGERTSSDSNNGSNWQVLATDNEPPRATSREPTPLSVVPDVNRGIPSVPRIPDRYHHYHKPRGPRHHHQDENRPPRAEADWRLGEAL